MTEQDKVIIDLTECKLLKEVSLVQMGANLKYILQAMFGGTRFPLEVKGTRTEIDKFVAALSKEKKYMNSYMKYGLGDPRTQRNKYALSNAVKSFERETGIKWPFK